MPDPEKLKCLIPSSSFSSSNSQTAEFVFESVPVVVTYINGWAVAKQPIWHRKKHWHRKYNGFPSSKKNI